MSDNKKYDIPVVLFVFKRLETVRMIIDQIKSVSPCKVYIFSDAARSNIANEEQDVIKVREYINQAIDWECEKKFYFAEDNKGCDQNIRDGLDTVFSEETAAVVFEDDAVPNIDFFEYCKELLEKYKDNKSIQYIAGFNAIGENDVIVDDYTFGNTPPMSGAFATWADRWNECDFEMHDWPQNKKNRRFRKEFYSLEMYRKTKREFDDAYFKRITAWDFMFEHDMLNKQRVAIVPKWNLATSYGYVDGAFHPQKKNEAERLLKIMTCSFQKMRFPLRGSQTIQNNREYCYLRQRKMLEVNGNYFQRRILSVYVFIKDIFYKILPDNVWNFLKKVIVK
jgi:hypothetical protein